MNPSLVFSNWQMAVLMMGFFFGDTIILNPAKQAKQDAWIAILLGWGLGFFLVLIYVNIALKHPGKNLIQILRVTFGKFMGNMLGLFYIGFMLLIPANILRVAGEFMINTSYTNTPLVFLIGSFIMVQIYALKKGFDIGAKTNEIMISLFFFTFLIHTGFLLPLLDHRNLLPMMQSDLTKILSSAYQFAILPFGDAVVFLSIFPSLQNKQKDLAKLAYISVMIIGAILLLQFLRDLLVLGPEIFAGTLFPTELSAKLIPRFTIEPLISATLSLGSLIKSGVFIYAAIVSLAEFFNIQYDNRIFVIPVNLLIMALAVWVSNSLFDQMAFLEKYWPYYAFPFEILIPLLIIIVTWFKSPRKLKA